jgi:tRNA (guanine37-N1)-methyltransferase
MKIDILTLFPEVFDFLYTYSIVGRAITNGIINIDITNIRDYSNNKHKKVDDYPFGGGKGMVMKPEPIAEAIKACKSEKTKVIYMSPQGAVLTQEKAKELSEESHILLLAGHYEGIDNRVIENYVDEEISIGDYVLTGGEIPIMVLIESIIRLIPGVLSSNESFEVESHYNGLLEYPQYTRPRVFEKSKVPEVLLSGDHANIEKWRKLKSFRTTLEKRPDLINKSTNLKKELELIDALIKQISKES